MQMPLALTISYQLQPVAAATEPPR
jgi:hypothetical protein